jgi:murein DD-endopeptidase MepM/ murein hydrolase activator NlpD
VDHRARQKPYRGSRRAPTPARGRYATAVTTAVVGTGVVALGASYSLPEPNGQTNRGAFDAGRPGAPTNTGLPGNTGVPGNAGGVRAPGNAPHPYPDAVRAGRSTSRVTSVAVSQQPGQDLWQLPVRGNYVISSMFGPRWGVLHPGTDLAVPEGTAIYAANAGAVILCRWNGGYGNNVLIRHDDGLVSVYGHASTLLCREGSRVAAGDLIALSGNTGYSTGPHLHFELRRNDRPFDALPFMRQHGVDLSKRIEVVTGGVLDPLG